MAFLHCHNCNWHQDDFWTEEYNPLIFSPRLFIKILLNKNLDEIFDMQQYTPVGEVYLTKVTWREYLCQLMYKRIMAIKSMKYRTYEEFEHLNPEKICPNCGKKTLCVD